MAGGQLRKLRVAMATALCGPRRGRRCLTTCLAESGAKDPAIALAESKVLQWAKAVWTGEVTDELVSPAWRRAAAKIRLGTLPASWVRGSISTILRVVGIIGWDPITPTSWRICGGGVLDLTAVPPAFETSCKQAGPESGLEGCRYK